MTSQQRGQSNGQILLSRGEPMIWLAGGAFAIACMMILSLLIFLIYKGMATHWPRSIVLYGLNTGEPIGGEFQNRQAYPIDRQSLGDYDPISLAHAEALLAGEDQVESGQLYIRTGNYDIENRHFAYVPEVKLQTLDRLRPDEFWLLERRAWGVLYGFPVRFEESFTPETDTEFLRLKLLTDQLDRFELGQALDAGDSFSGLLTEKLNSISNELVTQWKSTWNPAFNASLSNDTLYIVTKPASLRSAVDDAHARVMVLSVELDRAQVQLGALDRLLGVDRIRVRQAELDDKTDLQTVSEDAIQAATARTVVRSQWEAFDSSIQAWQKIFEGNSAALSRLGDIENQSQSQRVDELKPLDEAMEATSKFIEELPPQSRRAIQQLIATSERVTSAQIEINNQIARLEQLSTSSSIAMQVPVLDWLETIPDEKLPKDDRFSSISPELARVLSIDPDSSGVRHRLGTQSLLSLSMSSGNRFVWITPDMEPSVYRIGALREKQVLVSDIVRVVEPNRLGIVGKLSLYGSRWIEFLFGEPREGGIEGGFFPALWGTVVMTLIMSVAVMPFGVIAALYMREYAKGGWVLSLVRISINNLAGVPSIVYGVFGLAFFCYAIGGYIDGGPKKAGFDPWPSGTWFFAFAVTVFLGVGAFSFAALGSGSPAHMTRRRKRIAAASGLFWVLSLIGIVILLLKTPFFNGFYEASLPNPTFGKGCLLWASCTLALLTLPVVIVATEEALTAVPNSLREGSYACGAGKWQTLQRIVLPFARPGIITGFILAMARGAGEVAPMMLVGAIPFVLDLPLDLEFPFFHGSRSFMHLGFQIYSLGFQSQNSEAAKPMVFTATLLLLTIVTLLNMTAIWLRARLRKRFMGNQF